MPPTPTHRLRIHALVLSPVTQPDPFRLSSGEPFGKTELGALITGVNALYAQAGIQFDFDPNKDIEGESGNRLLDPTPPNEISALEIRAAAYQGKVLLAIREGGGGISGPGSYALVLKGGVDSNYILHVAHELGHYFGLPHTHAKCVRLSPYMYTAAQLNTTCDGQPWIYAEDAVRQALRPKLHGGGLTPELIAEGQAIIEATCDGDVTGKVAGGFFAVNDTRPSVREWPSDADKRCDPQPLSVPVSINAEVAHVFTFTPDRSNIMSYFNCPETNKFSPQQIAVMRSLIETGYRRHLLGPALIWSNWADISGDKLTDTPVAATAFRDALNVFAKDTHGNIFRRRATRTAAGQAWDVWNKLDGEPHALYAPAATAFDNKLYAFATSTAGAVMHNYTGDGQHFLPRWYEVPGHARAGNAPAVVAFDNHLQAFIVDPQGRIRQNYARAGQPFQSQWFVMPGGGVAKGNTRRRRLRQQALRLRRRPYGARLSQLRHFRSGLPTEMVLRPRRRHLPHQPHGSRARKPPLRLHRRRRPEALRQLGQESQPLRPLARSPRRRTRQHSPHSRRLERPPLPLRQRHQPTPLLQLGHAQLNAPPAGTHL